MFDIKKFAIGAFITGASVVALTGCMGTSVYGTPDASTPTGEPVDSSTDSLAWTPTLAHPAVANQIGVVGSGDNLTCQPGLKKATLSPLGTVDYNGATIAYETLDYGSDPDHNDFGVRLVIDGTLNGVQAAIVRSDDYYTVEDEILPWEVQDASVNWTPAMNTGTIEFNDMDFGGPNEISGIELCIDETANRPPVS